MGPEYPDTDQPALHQSDDAGDDRGELGRDQLDGAQAADNADELTEVAEDVANRSNGAAFAEQTADNPTNHDAAVDAAREARDQYRAERADREADADE